MSANALVGSRLDSCNSFLGVSLLLIFVSFNLVKIVWLELLPTPLSTHISLMLGSLFIGCILNTILYFKTVLCTSCYIVIIQNILYLFLNLDILFIKHVKAKLMACSMRSHTAIVTKGLVLVDTCVIVVSVCALEEVLVAGNFVLLFLLLLSYQLLLYLLLLYKLLLYLCFSA